LSGTDTTDTKDTELKSLQDGIEHALQKRREVLALLQTESKALTDRMQALAGQTTPPSRPHPKQSDFIGLAEAKYDAIKDVNQEFLHKTLLIGLSSHLCSLILANSKRVKVC
jgi:hypothetical protein